MLCYGFFKKEDGLIKKKSFQSKYSLHSPTQGTIEYPLFYLTGWLDKCVDAEGDDLL